MTRFARRCAIVFSAAMLLATLVPTARAGLGENVMFFEVYPGINDPRSSALDSALTYGVRLGGTVGTHLAVSGTLGYWETDGRASDPPVTASIELSSWLADATVAYLFRPQSRYASFALGGGIGGAFTDLDGELTTDELRITFENVRRDSFTLHAVGVALFSLSERVYLKPAVRWRWHEARDDDKVDREFTFAVGFTF